MPTDTPGLNASREAAEAILFCLDRRYRVDESLCERVARALLALTRPDDGELLRAVRTARTNVFDADGYIGDKRLSDLFTTAGTEVFDAVMFDARTMADYLHRFGLGVTTEGLG